MNQTASMTSISTLGQIVQSNSIVTLLTVAVVCAIALDASTRFAGTDNNGTKDGALNLPQAYILDTLSDEQAQDINQRLTALGAPMEEQQAPDSSSLTEQDKKMLTPERQKAQQGELSELYIGNNRYELVGIFRQAQPFAVFHQSTINAKATAITEQDTSYKWAQSQAIEQFLLSEIHQNSITILNGEHTITMRIFSPL